MIVDSLDNADLYRNIHPLLGRAFDFLRGTDLSELDCGRHPLDGDRLFALVQEYETKPAEQGEWEAHRKYWDLQYIAVGVERMGYVNIRSMAVKSPYNDAKDIEFFNGQGQLVTVGMGMFTIFGPQDVHAPGLALDCPVAIRKILMKVSVNL